MLAGGWGGSLTLPPQQPSLLASSSLVVIPPVGVQLVAAKHFGFTKRRRFAMRGVLVLIFGSFLSLPPLITGALKSTHAVNFIYRFFARGTQQARSLFLGGPAPRLVIIYAGSLMMTIHSSSPCGSIIEAAYPMLFPPLPLISYSHTIQNSTQRHATPPPQTPTIAICTLPPWV